MLSTVATFNELHGAHILRGRMLAEDIPAWITHEYQIANDWFHATARHGAWVQVPTIVETEAFEIVRAAKAGEFESLLVAQFGQIDALCCPKCGASDCWKRRPFIQGGLSILFCILYRPAIPPLLRWIYVCNACGKRFHSRYGLIGKADARSQFELRFAEAVVSDVSEMMEVQLLACESKFPASLEHDNANYASLLNSGGKGWVCRVGGFPRGFSIADAENRQFRALFVHPYFKRDGIGRYLHNAAVDWLFAQDTSSISLTIEPGTKAERFFQKAGWRLNDADEQGNYMYELQKDTWQSFRKKS